MNSQPKTLADSPRTVEHFVTLFDSAFLPQGLALYESLCRHGGEFTLWVVCLDVLCFNLLTSLQLPKLRCLDLRQYETPELKLVRQGRTQVEYCWTLTPFAPRWVFEADPYVERVTYVDADLFFLRSPAPIYAELRDSRKAVLITEHAYSPVCDRSDESGRYCVQFIVFLRTRSEKVRNWWELRCLEWCYQRHEDGKFGDQKYLESFPLLFPELVHVLSQRSALQAPWNAARFPWSEAIAYHFHGLRLLGPTGRVMLANGYYIPRFTLKHVYDQYLSCLGRLAPLLPEGFPSQTVPATLAEHLIRAIIRILRRRSFPGHADRHFGTIPLNFYRPADE